MRVTDRMMVNHTLNNLQQGRQRLGDAQTQVATGRQLQRASDDPVNAERAMTLASELRIVQKQTSNLGWSRDWLNSSDQALSDLNDLMIDAQKLALRATNDTNSEKELQAMTHQIDGILQEAISTANTRQNGHYIFSGHQTDTAPFGLIDGAIVYHGDDQEIRHMVEPGQTMQVNITGITGENGGLLSALTAIQDLKKTMGSGDKTGIQNAFEAIGSHQTDLSNAQSTIGARLQRIDRTSERLQQREVDLKALYSQLVDADMAETVAAMSAEDRAYELSLAAASRVMPRSLLDFLR